MDVLSDMLAVVRLTGAVFRDLELREHWSYVSPPGATVNAFLPGADHVIPFYLVIEGSCCARLFDGEDVSLRAGDAVLFPAGDRHSLAPGTEATPRLEPLEALRLEGAPQSSDIAQANASSKPTRIACGFLACNKRLAEPFLLSLPRLLKVSVRDRGVAAWIGSSVRHAIAESELLRPGSLIVLARLSEVLFAEAIRLHMDETPSGRPSWLAALRDEYVGRTLALLHEQPAFPWTVHKLAKEVGLSRSALAQRFSGLIGAPPMQYLKRWRISLAAMRLRESNASILRIATDIGYESEGAFNRAFKREIGMPPAAWRRHAVPSG
jgi:AraC-like DNA-binding protein